MRSKAEQMYRNFRKGFTLIELLVVIAIISLLMSVLLPSLKRAKEAAKRAHCLANVKTLSTGYMLYLQDSEGKLPPGSGPRPGAWSDMVESPYQHKPLSAPRKLQEEAIERGVLYPYVESVKVYRCPVAERNEFRTYSISTAMNWPYGGLGSAGGTNITNINQIRMTATRMLFLDDYCNDWNACWLVPATADYWWNSTPIRHGSGGNVFSFVDGHSEFHGWKDQRTIELAKLCYEQRSPEARNRPGNSPGEQADNEDLIWAAKAQWGTINRNTGTGTD